ncbi:MAG TPA: peptidoglycan editing factor PgeF [Candidatus Eisenbacteria bacterium]|nr:peptidoglycan editing factor PgeF [Candidatus Eisenbacteria bacterium]
MELTWLKVGAWERLDGLVHGFLGRRGGRSVGPYAGLNLSFRAGDDPAVVKDNICDAKKMLGLHDARIITMNQVHGDRIIEVTDRHLKEAGEADGLMTRTPDAYLGILTADCVPILFIAPREKIAAAVHAGWRGTLAGIAARMVSRFGEVYGVAAERIEAALGPSIGPCCYEVEEDVAGPMAQRWGATAPEAIASGGKKTFLDLRALNRGILEAAGVPSGRIFSIGPCTACHADDFFSYRRARGNTGRQLSFVGWRG